MNESFVEDGKPVLILPYGCPDWFKKYAEDQGYKTYSSVKLK